jgi:hypothetical protein
MPKNASVSEVGSGSGGKGLSMRPYQNCDKVRWKMLEDIDGLLFTAVRSMSGKFMMSMIYAFQLVEILSY